MPLLLRTSECLLGHGRGAGTAACRRCLLLKLLLQKVQPCEQLRMLLVHMALDLLPLAALGGQPLAAAQAGLLVALCPGLLQLLCLPQQSVSAVDP